jgi:hypothetical protein
VSYQRKVGDKFFPEFPLTKKPQVIYTLKYGKMAEDFIFIVNVVNNHRFLDEFLVLTAYRLHLRCIFFIASGVGLSPLYCDHFWPIVPAPDDR